MKKFVEALRNKPVRIYRGADKIPGTNKVRTYCPAGHLYSEESSLESIKARKNSHKRYK